MVSIPNFVVKTFLLVSLHRHSYCTTPGESKTRIRSNVEVHVTCFTRMCMKTSDNLSAKNMWLYSFPTEDPFSGAVWWITVPCQGKLLLTNSPHAWGQFSRQTGAHFGSPSKMKRPSQNEYCRWNSSPRNMVCSTTISGIGFVGFLFSPVNQRNSCLYILAGFWWGWIRFFKLSRLD